MFTMSLSSYSISSYMASHSLAACSVIFSVRFFFFMDPRRAIQHMHAEEEEEAEPVPKMLFIVIACVGGGI